MHSLKTSLHGAGLGLRRDFLWQVDESAAAAVDFFEVAPENWLEVGGKLGRRLRELTAKYPFTTHGLSLSIGAPAALDVDFVRRIKQFLDAHGITHYSEHLSYCSDGGHLYDLLPIPFTTEAVHWVAARVRQVQDILERPLILENVSYYAAPGQELTEIEFINAVLAESGAQLLLDVNNVYVNSVNHGYDPHHFLAQLPADRIAYGHIAGHFRETEDFIIDSHGANVIDPVWSLLATAYAQLGVFPTLLERDFNIPPLPELLGEVQSIRDYQRPNQEVRHVISS